MRSCHSHGTVILPKNASSAGMAIDDKGIGVPHNQRHRSRPNKRKANESALAYTEDDILRKGTRNYLTRSIRHRNGQRPDDKNCRQIQSEEGRCAQRTIRRKREGNGPRTAARPEDDGRDNEGSKQEDSRDEQADFIPSRVYQNRQHMRAFPTVDDWLGTISERPIKMRRSRSVGGPSAALMGGSIKNKGPRVGGSWHFPSETNTACC